jgi:hypothetical protein
VIVVFPSASLLFFAYHFFFPFIDFAILAGCCVLITDRLMFFACRGFLVPTLSYQCTEKNNNALLLQSFSNPVKVLEREKTIVKIDIKSDLINTTVLASTGTSNASLCQVLSLKFVIVMF